MNRERVSERSGDPFFVYTDFVQGSEAVWKRRLER